MQRKVSVPRHRKTFPRFKHPVTYRMRSRGDSLNLSTVPIEPPRQNLPRRCKLNQPCYDIDDIVELETKKSGNKKKDVASSSSHILESTIVQTSDVVTVQRESDIRLKTFSLFSWLIDMKIVVQGNTYVCYPRSINTKFKYGCITRYGIVCCCCSSLFSASQFQLHCGADSSNKPYQNLFIIPAQVSLLACLMEAWNQHSVPAKNGYNHVSKRARYKDYHDDSCMICADGGDLMCCEKCPSTYHLKCLGFVRVPKGEWHCPFCDCIYCHSSKGLLLTCTQCLKKYHWKCSDLNKEKAYFHDIHQTFCGLSCLQVNNKIESVVGRRMHLEPEYCWTVVRRMDLDAAGQHPDDLYKRVHCNSMVAVAAAVMEDSFKIIVDRQSRANTVQSVVYSCGSNFTRTNFGRFYTAILEYHGQVATVATLRITTPGLAEIPFIATVEGYRNSGLCRRLLGALESLFVEMGVKHILIPSAPDMVTNWKKKFGFRPIDNDMKSKIRELNTLMFPGTTRLQKVMRTLSGHDLNLPPAE